MTASPKNPVSPETTDSWNRWLPTLVAIVGVLGMLLYESRNYGQLEARVHTVESRQTEIVATMDKMTENMIPRSEYAANIAEVKASFARMEILQRTTGEKVDRLFELMYAARGKAE